MAQLAAARSPEALETQALGSCVGVVLYDHYARVGGIAHAMLPDVNYAKSSSRSNLAKFVNTALEQLLSRMLELGAQRKHIKARLAGGANMFPDIPTRESVHIGKRNTDAARQYLRSFKIPITAEEIGGSVGRTITLNTVTGKLKVRTIHYGEKEI